MDDIDVFSVSELSAEQRACDKSNPRPKGYGLQHI